MDKNDLIQRIGTLISTDSEFANDRWQGLSLIFDEIDEAGVGMSGYMYAGDKVIPVLPQSNSTEIEEAVLALREATIAPDGSKWHGCLVQLSRPGPEIGIEFEFDDPLRWKITPRNYEHMMEALRPSR